jgi:hypothetical protein
LEIWKLHLKPPVPLAEDVDLNRIAHQFNFSGGQIALAVKSAAVSAAIRGDLITMSDLLDACEDEVRGCFDSSRIVGKAIGFCN